MLFSQGSRWSIVLGATLFATQARAQGTAPAPPPRIMNRIARSHFETGNEYFQVSRYADAAREIRSAFDITHQPELLFNIARALEADGQIAEALASYQQFVDAGAPGFDRDVLTARMDNLRARLPPPSPPPAPVPVPVVVEPPAPPPVPAPAPAPVVVEPPPPVPVPVVVRPPPSPMPPRTRTAYRLSTASVVGPPVLLGAGAVLGGLAVWQGVVAARYVNALDNANHGTPWDANAQDAQAHGGASIALAYSFGIAGGALAVGSVVWWALRGRGTAYEVPIAFVVPGRDGHGVVFGVGGAL